MTRVPTLISIIFICFQSFAVSPFDKNLPRELAPFEKAVQILSYRAAGPAPVGPVQALGEWEEAESVMTLWTNPSYVKALSENGPVTLIADDSSAKNEWVTWLKRNQISEKNISFLLAQTDSIWVRDYGPWWILDGQNQFGIVDTTYNRPRPNDDQLPTSVARLLNVPLFKPEVVHTGGNFYSDGYESAFSSTLVFRENQSLSVQDILNRMLSFLGIQKYTTSALGENVTIEHIDTFGKLVSPDTWVFSDFPAGSRFKNDSDRMVQTLKTMKSAYGTPYKIYRMPMIKRNSFSKEDYRAYINSFISNGVLYFPTYGNDENDQKATEIYQQALPGYKIRGVDNGNTEWGDSVHCRSRNILKKNALFIFPKIENRDGGYSVVAKVVASPGFRLAQSPVLHLQVNGRSEFYSMNSKSSDVFTYGLDVKSGDQVKFFVSAEDTSGVKKVSPMKAPLQSIEWNVP